MEVGRKSAPLRQFHKDQTDIKLGLHPGGSYGSSRGTTTRRIDKPSRIVYDSSIGQMKVIRRPGRRSKPSRGVEWGMQGRGRELTQKFVTRRQELESD